MSSYAINVKCSRCGEWRVVNPQPGFDRQHYVCDQCIEREKQLRFEYLRRFYFWVEKHHPRILNEYLKRGLANVEDD